MSIKLKKKRNIIVLYAQETIRYVKKILFKVVLGAQVNKKIKLVFCILGMICGIHMRGLEWRDAIETKHRNKATCNNYRQPSSVDIRYI
jgi:hypothetical protein